MTTSDASWSTSCRVIGELERPDHHYLTEQDECVFWGEYTSRAGFTHSKTNQLIQNLKKSPLVRGTAQWHYKDVAIREVAAAMAAAIKPEFLPSLTFVPIPPSKLPNDPEYDDRMERVSRLAFAAGTRPLIRSTVSREARHKGDNKHDPDELRATLALDLTQITVPPTHVFLIDDVITTGCSFRVCKQMLVEQFPDIKVTGMFVARRALPPTSADFEAFDDF